MLARANGVAELLPRRHATATAEPNTRLLTAEIMCR